MSLALVPAGSALLRTRRPGYEQRLVPIVITPNDSQPVEIRLRTVTQLEAVRVTAEATSRRAMLNGFANRSSLGFGHFLKPADFDKLRDEPMQFVLSRMGLRQHRVVPGGTLAAGMLSGGVIMSGGHGTGICPVTIYIDGGLFYTAKSGSPPPDISLLLTGDYVAAEYYASSAEIPAEYSTTDDDCGVLLLWTRD